MTFKLHKNVKWHDGKPLTSADVKFTFDTIIKKKYPYAAFLGNVAEIATPDDYTVVLKLKTPDMSFVPDDGPGRRRGPARSIRSISGKGRTVSTRDRNVNNPIGSGPVQVRALGKGRARRARGQQGLFPRQAGKSTA